MLRRKFELILNFLRFGATLKIRKKSKFGRNQLKLSTQHKCMYMYYFKKS